MFCPKCATQNLEGASYCRSCGANISLIPHALTGQLPQAQSDQFDFGRRGRKRGREGTMESAFRNAFMGIAFLLVSIALSFSPMGRGWWFWMMIPAFSMMGSGVAQYVRVKERERQALRGANLNQPAMPASPRVEVFAARSTGELMATPPSVTEGTTRHLGAEAPTKHLDASSEASE
ncbi:MAG TPA: zinc ribbon domain-containing protein [Pyrinomonadaceae bacterium]|nr:zinc ribbon domain-containing protein [Pyrinomonadaceae bacterium]